MTAKLLFTMTNPNATCTAASLLWCNMMLSGTTTPTADHFKDSDPTLLAMMDTVGVRQLDADPSTQVALAQFEIVTQGAATITSAALAAEFKANAPHLGIFWNSFHTMAYRYHHVDKRYFDNNYGLWKASKTADIVAKMEEIRTHEYNGAPWCGYAVVRFGNRLRIAI